ncbi:hypothetical protein C0992_009475 [Termitomyces sp. T32_za158]|nr:hypothetical protein C0992_009475 [Termitomyces sp. T32_za158]
MPPEPSNIAHGVSRRVTRKTTSEDEVDIRRARGEIPVINLNVNLQLAVDVPPYAQMVVFLLVKAQGIIYLSSIQYSLILARFVLADTTQLHAKIAEMGQRIRQLEDALAIFQAGISNETHPLLRDELLLIKFGPDKGQVPEREHPPRENFTNSIDALGTLTIGDHGQVKYFGRSAGSEALLLAGAELDKIASGLENELALEVSPEISQLSSSFPFTAPTSSEKYERALDVLFGYLPSQPRAWSLCETYMEHASWAFRPMKRDEIIDETLSPIYKSMKERRSTDSPGPHIIFPHKLAVLFLVFALGALVDLTLEPYNVESDTYYHLSRACLSLRSIFESPEITTVQAVVLMASYHGLGGKRYTTDSVWSLTSLGCKLAQSIGLHRDSARFSMDPRTVQRRRALFWELFSTDLFYSLATGRPPSIRLSYVDCEFPEDDEATIDKDGNLLKGYYQWKYEFTKEIASTVTELTLTAEPPHYQTVLDLDRKVREKALPPHLNVFMSPEDEHCTPSVYMRGCLLGQYRTVNGGAFGHIYSQQLFVQVWYHISYADFSTQIIVGTIVTRSPSSSMAPSAFIELGLACDLFEKGASHSRRARSGLAILGKLREKAFQVYSQLRSGNQSTNAVLSVGKPDYGDDELALFGGQTRVLVSKLLKKSSIRQQPASSIHSGDSTAGSPIEMPPDVHPSLVEYLSKIPLDHTNNPINPHHVSASPTLPYTSQNTFQQSRTYLPPDQEMKSSVQSPWTSPVSLTTSVSNQRSYMDNSSSLPLPNIPFDSVPDYGNSAIKSDSSENLVDLGMMMTGDSGMDEQWMSFMRDSGLLEGNNAGTCGPMS